MSDFLLNVFDDVKAATKLYRRLIMRGRPYVMRMINIYRIKHSPNVTYFPWFSSMMLIKSSKLPFLISMETNISSDAMIALLNRMVNKSLYTFLMSSLDFCSMSSPVILKFMKKKDTKNVSTLKQFRHIMKSFKS